jgi:2-iminobutanoate/2-iminopropanoate deaminase
MPAEIVAASTERAPAAIGPYSQAIVAGDLVFCSGMVALDSQTGRLIDGDIRQQTERIFDNISAVLDAAGSALDRVAKVTIFMTDLGEFTAMNETYANCFGQHRPARSTVQVAALPRGARIEIEVIALRNRTV